MRLTIAMTIIFHFYIVRIINIWNYNIIFTICSGIYRIWAVLSRISVKSEIPLHFGMPKKMSQPHWTYGAFFRFCWSNSELSAFITAFVVVVVELFVVLLLVLLLPFWYDLVDCITDVWLGGIVWVWVEFVDLFIVGQYCARKQTVVVNSGKYYNFQNERKKWREETNIFTII